jgi:hypothetical protein
VCSGAFLSFFAQLNFDIIASWHFVYAVISNEEVLLYEAHCPSNAAVYVQASKNLNC